MTSTTPVVPLPAPGMDCGVSLERALQGRRSVREYLDEPITLAQLAQLAWAAQGQTHPDGPRTAPSAGALFPLETYIAAGRVDGLAAGVYVYQPASHCLLRRSAADPRAALAEAALGQDWIRESAAVFVFTSVDARITGKYGEQGLRFVDMEAGHAAQNLALQAQALGLGTCMVGAFDETQVARLLGLPADQRPVYAVPVGKR